MSIFFCTITLESIYSKNQGKFSDLPGSILNIRSFGVLAPILITMFYTDHKHKAMYLAICFQVSLLLLIGTKTQAHINSEIEFYETPVIAEEINHRKLYQERVTLLVPWFNVLACTAIILNNGVQLINQVKKKE